MTKTDILARKKRLLPMQKTEISRAQHITTERNTVCENEKGTRAFLPVCLFAIFGGLIAAVLFQQL
jgi:hypothetical protein